MRITRLMALGTAAGAALCFALPAAVASASPPVDAITSVSSVCQADGYYQVTVTFSHRGRIEARVYDVIGGVRRDSDHAWYRGTGDATFQGTLYGGGGATVTIEAHLLKTGSRHTLVDAVTPVSIDAGTCVAAS